MAVERLEFMDIIKERLIQPDKLDNQTMTKFYLHDLGLSWAGLNL
jgi:hypothetical protein